MPRRHARLRVVATGPKGSVPVRVRRPPRLDLMTSTVRRGFGPGFTPNGPLRRVVRYLEDQITAWSRWPIAAPDELKSLQRRAWQSGSWRRRS